MRSSFSRQELVQRGIDVRRHGPLRQKLLLDASDDVTPHLPTRVDVGRLTTPTADDELATRRRSWNDDAVLDVISHGVQFIECIFQMKTGLRFHCCFFLLHQNPIFISAFDHLRTTKSSSTFRKIIVVVVVIDRRIRDRIPPRLI